MPRYKYHTKKYTDLTEIENALKEIGEHPNIIEIALDRIKQGHRFVYLTSNEREVHWTHYVPDGTQPPQEGFLIIKKRL